MNEAQAYAYASGRPLVNVDPSGRTVEVAGSWAGAWSWLYYNPLLGHVGRTLHDDRNVKCRVREAAVFSHGGAYTKCVKGSGCGDSGEWFCTVDYNPITVQSFLQATFPGVPYSAEAALTHELTHAYFDVITGTENYDSGGLAVQYENVARQQLGVALRPFH